MKQSSYEIFTVLKNFSDPIIERSIYLVSHYDEPGMFDGRPVFANVRDADTEHAGIPKIQNYYLSPTLTLNPQKFPR